MSTNGLPDEEVAACIALEKYLFGEPQWVKRPADSNFLIASFTVLSKSEETIPGLIVELHYRNDVLNRCKFKFTLFKLHEGRKLRAYQIEVRPPEVRTHTDVDGHRYGPRQHFGEKFAELQNDEGLGCDHFEEWFKVFLRNANIQYGGPYKLPPAQWQLL